MPLGPPTAEHLRALERRRTDVTPAPNRCCSNAARRASRISTGRLHQVPCDADATSKQLDDAIAEYRADLQRSTIPERYQHLGGGGERRASSAGQLAPLGYNDEQLRRAFGQVGRGDTAVLEDEGLQHGDRTDPG